MQQPERIKITMLGNSGAGKTCFMVGMYAAMRFGVKGFSFTTDGDTDLDLSLLWDQMVEVNDNSRWPISTAQTTTYEFDFCYGLRPLMGFDWIDYRGRALEDRSTAQDTQELKNHLDQASCVFLCVSGEYLTEGILDRERFIARKTAIQRMNLLLRDMRNQPAIVIVLTKYDLVPDQYRSAILEGVKELFNPFFAANSGWLVLVCPVTLGKDVSRGGAIDPRNIHLPVTFAVYQAFEGLVKNLQQSQKLASAAQEQAMSNWFTKTFGQRGITTRGEELKQYTAKIEEAQKNMKLLIAQLMRNTSIFYQGNEVEIDV